jgi:hypothetical protein
MCLTVFVASDSPLPVFESDSVIPLFSAGPVPDDAAAVRRLFTKSHVVELTYGGCGCGFYCDESDPANEAYVRDKAIVARLTEYIAAAAETTGAEVYCCWEGDWNDEPIEAVAVGLDHFGGNSFAFIEKQFMTVTGA